MYYCKNCGEPYQTEEAVLCVRCGVSKGVGNNYCHFCGRAVTPDTAVCLSCGVPCNGFAAAQVAATGAKSRIAAGLLGIFLGGLGIHNFYLGYTKKAVAQFLLTIIGFLFCCILIGVIPMMVSSIWGLVEGIMLLCNKISTDGQGHPLSE